MTTFVKLLILAVLMFFFICVCAFVVSRAKNEFVIAIFIVLASLLCLILLLVMVGLITCT